MWPAERKAKAVRFAAALAAAAGTHALAGRAWADPILPTIPNNNFNIVDFGAATSNTPTQNFSAIQSAIIACNQAGGGNIVVPSGTFVSLPGIVIGNSTNLHLDGTLQAAPYAAYANYTTHFVSFSSAHDVELSGAGTLDGNATFSTSTSDTEWWGNPTLNIAAQSSRPRLVYISTCANILVRDVHIKNSPSFHVAFSGSNGEITIDSATVTAPSNAPNTDAIDITGINGLVKNCNISVGDDNVVMKPQSTYCANITVSSCTFGTGHGVSVGGQTNMGLNGFTVGNCTFSGTSNGIHLKAGRGFGGLVQNLTFSNLTMSGVTNPFDVSGYYISGGDVTGPLDPTHVPPGQTLTGAPVLADLPVAFVAGSTPQWQNVTFSNIHINSSSSNNFFYGTPEATIQNLVLNDVIYQNSPSKGLNFVNDADVHLTGATAAPVQCAVVTSLELSGTPATPPTLTQSYSSSLASTAATRKANAGSYYNFDPNFDPTSVNTVRVAADLNLGMSAGTSGAYNLSGGTLAVGGVAYIGNSGTGIFSQTGGTAILAAAVLGSAPGGSGSLTVSGGTFSAASTAVQNNSRFNYNGGTVSTGALSIGSGGRVVLSPGANKVLRTTALSIDPGSQLDLADNKMIIDYTGSPGTLADDLRQHLLAGRIISSTHISSTTIGYGDNAGLGFSTFGGFAVDSTSLLLKYTYAGDANLDGKVDINDLYALAQHWNTGGDLWTGGDFNYDGAVDVADLSLLAGNWQAGVGSPLGMPLAEALATLDLSQVAVPEPTSPALIGLALMGLLACSNSPRLRRHVGRVSTRRLPLPGAL